MTNNMNPEHLVLMSVLLIFPTVLFFCSFAFNVLCKCVSTNRFLATSQMQPTDARQVFPCFDEPALKAVFNITIIHRPKSEALSNSPGG